MSIPQITDLPDYENPPVVETILGVQFDRLPGFRSVHLGAFWEILGRTDWPQIADAPPLLQQFERFRGAANWGQLDLQLMMSQDASQRAQMKNQTGDRMIQVQNGRLHFNWMKQGEAKYPKYEKVRDGFRDVLGKFTKFVRDLNLGSFCPNQWEVTYLNQIPAGTVWKVPSDWGFFRLLGTAAIPGDVESFDGAWHFAIPQDRGRLHVQWQHARQPGPTPKDIIVLNLTARGALESANTEDSMIAGIDLGRETIVRAFPALMSDDANKYWGLKHAGT